MTEKEIKFLKWVADFYSWQLANCPEAYDYVRKRVVDPLIISEFKLGLAGSYNELSRTIERDAPSFMTLALDMELVRVNDKGNYYDFFRERIMFPIEDEHGNLVGFSGRAFLEGAKVKYLNSPASKWFDKSELIYNLYHARPSIKDKGFAYIVEGFFDATTLHGYLKENVVASMGTSFSRSHAEILKSYTDKVIIAYDGDDAGYEATQQLIKVLKDLNFKIKIAEFPVGEDPDSYAFKHEELGPLDNAINPYEFAFTREYAKLIDGKHKSVQISEAVNTLPKVLKGASRATYESLFMKVANDLSIDWISYRHDLEAIHGFTFNRDISITREFERKGVDGMYEAKLFKGGEVILETTSTLLVHYYKQVSIRMKSYEHSEILARARLAKELYEVDPHAVPESYLLDYVVGNYSQIKDNEDKHEILQKFYKYYLDTEVLEEAMYDESD